MRDARGRLIAERLDEGEDEEWQPAGAERAHDDAERLGRLALVRRRDSVQSRLAEEAEASLVVARRRRRRRRGHEQLVAGRALAQPVVRDHDHVVHGAALLPQRRGRPRRGCRMAATANGRHFPP